jgi:hypothetical protein
VIDLRRHSWQRHVGEERPKALLFSLVVLSLPHACTAQTLRTIVTIGQEAK